MRQRFKCQYHIIRYRMALKDSNRLQKACPDVASSGVHKARTTAAFKRLDSALSDKLMSRCTNRYFNRLLSKI